MKKLMFLFIVAAVAAALAACGSSDETSDLDSGNDTAKQGKSGENQLVAAEEDEDRIVERVRLAADYDNALSPQSQLALGTLQLEETDFAVDEALAGELLPLWQALQSLSSSEVTADAELNAVINQIQDTMLAEQINTIADMKLTEEGFMDLLESGDLTFGRGGFGSGAGDSGGTGFRAEFGGGPGAGIPGDLPGGGPGGGFGGLGAGPGGGFGNLSEDAIATRQAQFAEGDFDPVFREGVLLGAVIRLMQQKSGEEVRVPGDILSTVFAIVGEETSLTAEEIQEQLASGVILSELIAANDSDVEKVRSALIDAFNDLPNRDDIDAVQMADEWLGLDR